MTENINHEYKFPYVIIPREEFQGKPALFLLIISIFSLHKLMTVSNVKTRISDVLLVSLVSVGVMKVDVSCHSEVLVILAIISSIFNQHFKCYLEYLERNPRFVNGR